MRASLSGYITSMYILHQAANTLERLPAAPQKPLAKDAHLEFVRDYEYKLPERMGKVDLSVG